MNKFLESQKIYFRPYEKFDAVFLKKWPNLLAEPFLKINKNDIVFVAVDTTNEDPIGVVVLNEIDYIPRKASIKIALDRKYWQKEHMNEMMEMTVFYAFDRLNLNRISLAYSSSNRKIGNNAKQAGFISECVFRKDIYSGGKYYNKIVTAVLRENYYNNFYREHSKRFK